MYKEIDIDSLGRRKTYEWFKGFSNPTYSVNVRMDVTKLVNYVKENNRSFFVCFLYILVNGLNSVKEFRMRFYKGKAVIYDDINPSFTVLNGKDNFDNVRFKNIHDFNLFYSCARKCIEDVKNGNSVSEDGYNLEDIFNEYYITCLPWLDFTSVTHPISDDINSNSVPRICFGKYTLDNDKYYMMLNITVSHVFVDGLHISRAFNKIQELLDDTYNVLK